jgi:hypothetical protein
MKESGFNAEVDIYIAKAPAFQQPILRRLRELVHEAWPQVEESIVGGKVSFRLEGVTLADMLSCQDFCRFNFVGPFVNGGLAKEGLLNDVKWMVFGRLVSLKDLPSDRAIRSYLRQAAPSRGE